MKTSIFLLTLLVSLGASANPVERFFNKKPAQQVAGSCNGVPISQHPQAQQSLQFLCRTGFAVGYNGQTKTPAWVMERVIGKNLGGIAEREARFQADTELPVRMRAEDKDYAMKAQGSICRENPGNVEHCMDRGHMAPAANLRWTEEGMRQSFLLSNVVPQNAKMNRGIWAYLESRVRDWAAEDGELVVYTGPIYREERGFIGKRVMVPSHLYKIVWNPKTGQKAGYVMPNEPISMCERSRCSKREMESALQRYEVRDVAQIERATGIRFFH